MSEITTDLRSNLPPGAVSIQEKHPVDVSSVVGVGDRLISYLMSVSAFMRQVPDYGSPARDPWLVKFLHEPGNDLLAGALSTVCAKAVSTSWYVEGPVQLALLARKMLLTWSRGEAGYGWDNFCWPWVQGYYNRDGGGCAELLRASATDLDGPSMGFAHLDESKCRLTGDADYPILYNNVERKKEIKVHRAQVSRIVDMPIGEQSYRGLGYCSVSRSATTAQVLMDVVRYKRERLSDLPAAGLLILNNLGEQQWNDLQAKYDARQSNKGNEIWRDIMVALGVDPAYPTTAELIPFSELPEHFSEKEATEIGVYSFALAFREDPREFWPVSAGPLGTATEAKVSARKARSKGVGTVYVAIERQLNRPDALPPGVTFHFDFLDDEEDMLRAEINNVKTQWIRRIWEASPNRFSGGDRPPEVGAPPGEPPEEPAEAEDRARRQALAPDLDPTLSQGIINTEQAQQLLVREGVVPADILGLSVDTDRLYDTRAYQMRLAMFGPKVRVYRDGHCVRCG